MSKNGDDMTRSKRIFRLAALFFLLPAVLVAGCMRAAIPPPQPVPGSLQDTQAVREKTIVIDPGHGGSEQGAVGVQGLKESEVNLGVALYLWGLLKEAGAHPVLTRAVDKNVFDGPEFSLVKDLQARSELSNSLKADLFVSIHHNASAQDTKKNDLIIFYKLQDPGRSRDIAESVCDGLTSRLNPESASVRAGNYHVLRNTRAPAVLGESSYMSNLQNETSLAYHRTLSREAHGYFTGILNYFNGGVPLLTRAWPDGHGLSTTLPRITAHISPGPDTETIDASTVSVQLDGDPVSSFTVDDNGTIAFVPPKPLGNGPHRFCITARNTAGNISQDECRAFSVSLPPGRIEVTPLFATAPADGITRTPVDVAVSDTLGRPVIDGTRVSLTTTAGMFLDPDVHTAGGRARAVLISDEMPGKAAITAAAGPAAGNGTVSFGSFGDAVFTATLRTPGGVPVEDVQLVRNGTVVARSDAGGFVYDRTAATGRTGYGLQKPGYELLTITPVLSAGSTAIENLQLTPVDGGLFFGKTIMLDPAGTTIRALPIINSLREHIEEAGGKAVITWQSAPAPDARQRVITATRAKADVFITIELGESSPVAGHYFRSEKGKLLAEAVCTCVEDCGGPPGAPCRIVHTTRYVIMHTPMPALWLCLPESAAEQGEETAACLYRALYVLFERYQGG